MANAATGDAVTRLIHRKAGSIPAHTISPGGERRPRCRELAKNASLAAWRETNAIMPKWFSCLVESIGIGIITLAVLMAMITFFVEKCS